MGGGGAEAHVDDARGDAGVSGKAHAGLAVKNCDLRSICTRYMIYLGTRGVVPTSLFHWGLATRSFVATLFAVVK